MIREVLNHVLRKPNTDQYPFVKTEKCDKFRGRIQFLAERCIGCKFCMRDCPSNAITINKIADKQFECVIHNEKCIYCAQCVLSCPKQALESTKDFELAQLSKGPLKVTYAAQKKAPTEEKAAPQEAPKASETVGPEKSAEK
jgi:formate hydrogenlyase subunit 6/NADH:ubiquinone oxidoreductase subunit I